MTIVRWEPFRNLAALQDRINRMFDDAFSAQHGADDDLSLCAWTPMVDIFATDDGLILKADLPGVPKESISLEIKENVLTLKGDRAPEKEIDADRFYRRERCCGSFQRSFNLQWRVDPSKVKAQFKDGVLEVVLSKPEEDKPKKIAVSID